METAQFKVIEGNKPILFSAPHVFPHRRPSLNVGYKIGEPYTDEIVKQICAETGCWGIYLLRECDYDPSYHKEGKNEYKRKVRDIIKENKIKRYVDIHGLKDNGYFDIGIYYTTRFSKSLSFAYDIEKIMDRGELKGLNTQILRFLDNEQETLGEYVASDLRVPAVQIEIARYIRSDDNLRNFLITNLSQIVDKNIIG